MSGGIVGWVTQVIKSLGYFGVAGLIALENVFPPIPSEVILPLAGLLTGQGQFSYIGVVAAATVGSVIGAWVLYALGLKLGKQRVLRLVKRHGQWLLLTEHDLHRASDWFARYGGKAVLFGRCVPGIRSLVSIPAGIERMPLGRFTLFTALGSGVWNAALVGLGWWLGRQWKQVSHYMQYANYAIWAAIIIAIAMFIWRRSRTSRSRPARGEST